MDWRERKPERETSGEAPTLFLLRGGGLCELKLSWGSCQKAIDCITYCLYIKISLNPANGPEHLRF